MEKKIALYCCENSAYKAAACLTGPELQKGIEIIKLPCTGKMEINLILKTLEQGYAGVLVAGCPIDNCKYIRGSSRAEKRIEKTRELLKAAGIPEQRVRMEFLSSVDSHKLAGAIKEMKQELEGVMS